MLRSCESRVPKIHNQMSLKPYKMNSNYYLHKAKESFKMNDYPVAYKHFVIYFDSLEDPAVSTPVVQLCFTKLVCRIGIVLEESNDTEELLKVYLQALNFFPNNYIILNNLGAYLFKMGQVDIARTYLEKAVSCSKNYLPAEKNLMHCKWRQIPRWHFKMLNDSPRNYSYHIAVQRAMEKGFKDVIDVGAGCGLLSLMASGDSEANVTAIEENKILAKMCESVMKEHGRKNVKVLHCNSVSLTEPPGRCNLLITEIFDCALFGERMLDTLSHALQILVSEKDNFKIIPCAARVYACAIDYRDKQCFRVVNHPPVLGLPRMCIRQADPEPYEAENLASKKFSYVSDPVVIYELDFYNGAQLDKMSKDDIGKIVKFTCLQDATFTSIAVWFELDLDEDLTVTTDPNSDEKLNCWEQAVFHLDHPIEVKKGQIVQFQVTVLDGQLTFDQIEKVLTCVSCWEVPKEIVSFLNDSALIDALLALAGRFKNPEFSSLFDHPQKPIMDMMPFPLIGFLLASSHGLPFYTTTKSETDSRYVNFFNYILRINGIPLDRISVIENKMRPNTAMCGIHKYLKKCKACLIDTINTDGSIHPAINLKEKVRSNELNVLIMPAKVVVKAVIIYSEHLETWNKVNDWNLGDYKFAKFMNQYSGNEHPDLDSDFAYDTYCGPVAFIVDDKGYVKKTQNVLMAETGYINGIFTWYEIQFHNSVNFSTKDSSHIRKTCYLLGHKAVERGELFKLVMRREGPYLDFRLEK